MTELINAITTTTTTMIILLKHRQSKNFIVNKVWS